MSDDEESRRLYEERIAQIIEVDLRMHAAEERGREEGEEIGEIKKGIRDAKNMISLGMDDEIIIKVTELPAEKIAQLRSEAESE
jgi:predicted transposase/invertase (TIGR01784 family)